MKYYPHLIKKELKVLPDYFKASKHLSKSTNKFLTILEYVFAGCAFVAGCALISHIFQSILLLFLAFIISPQGHLFIERSMKFHITPRIKIVLCFALLVMVISLSPYYSKVDRQNAITLRLKQERDSLQRRQAEIDNQIRIDSFNYHLKNVVESKNNTSALVELQKATLFASSQDDKDLIDGEKKKITTKQADELIKSGKYESAAAILNELIIDEGSNADFRYKRAICFSKSGRTDEAVQDLKVAMESGSTDAKKLYEKVNPVKRRVVGYVTRCCDGTTSYSTGRGTCSHHGGVCNWNDPIYEESRKYE